MILREVIHMNSHGKGSDPKAALYEALLKLKTPEECYAFFADLCTVSEQMAMEQRFEVATLLDQGCIYNDVLEKTGVSSATVSRVKLALQYGAGGYRSVLDRMKEDEA
jgi:TrpR-related protein YerC/YecD